MSFEMKKAPRDAEKLQEEGMEIVKAVTEFGGFVDSRGFLNSWLNGMKVLEERDSDNKIISLAFMITGKRWFDNYETATILETYGNHTAIIEFARTIAQAVGAYSLFVDTKEVIEKESAFIHTIVEYKL